MNTNKKVLKISQCNEYKQKSFKDFSVHGNVTLMSVNHFTVVSCSENLLYLEATA